MNTTPYMKKISKKIRPMLKTMTYREVAKTLNKQGICTAHGNKFDANTVNYCVSKYISN